MSETNGYDCGRGPGVGLCTNEKCAALLVKIRSKKQADEGKTVSGCTRREISRRIPFPPKLASLGSRRALEARARRRRCGCAACRSRIFPHQLRRTGPRRARAARSVMWCSPRTLSRPRGDGRTRWLMIPVRRPMGIDCGQTRRVRRRAVHINALASFESLQIPSCLPDPDGSDGVPRHVRVRAPARSRTIIVVYISSYAQGLVKPSKSLIRARKIALHAGIFSSAAPRRRIDSPKIRWRWRNWID